MSRAWVVTYVKTGYFITYSAFQENNFDIDECHYTSDSAVVYMYIHLKNVIKRTKLAALLSGQQEEKKITLFEVVGYDSITPVTNDTPVSDHIGLKILLEHHLSGNSSFVSCTDGDPGIKRGYLWESNMPERLKEMVKGRNKRLMSFVEEIDTMCAQSKQKDARIEFLQDQHAEKDARIQELRTRMHKYQYVCHVLRIRIGDLDQDTRNKLVAHDHQGRPLMPEFFDFSPEARKEWSNPHGGRY